MEKGTYTMKVSLGGLSWRWLLVAVCLASLLPLTTALAAPLGHPAAQSSACAVSYTVNQWGGGFTAEVVITNRGAALSGWTLTWSFSGDQQITNIWNASYTQSGNKVTARNMDYNASLPSGGTASMGFQASFSGSNATPTDFALNGAACNGGTSPTAAPTGTAAPTRTASPTGTAAPTRTPAPPATSTPVRPTPTPTKAATVAADGSGTYRTVQAAINAVPTNNNKRIVITIKPGTYREIVTIPANKPYITLQGLGSTPSQTVIVNNHSNAGGYGTSNSATVFAYGNELNVFNLTISNDYGVGSQAVAAHLNGDRQIFNNVRFLGNQDTLLVNDKTRAYVVNSYIEGTVDFIFGGGTAVFDRCQIYEKRSSGGPITAASTPANKTYGFLFYRSTITGAANNVTQLGRPWRPDGQVLYRESTLSATMKTSQPWIDMSGNSWTNARFFEYKNTGAGATVNGNRPQLSDSQAANYTPQRYLTGTDGWNPF